MKNKILILSLYISFNAFSQKCKTPMLLYNETFRKKYSYKTIKYQNKNIVVISHSKLTIKELYNKIYNTKVNFKLKDKSLDTLKMSYIINCNSKTTEKEANHKLIKFILDLYDIKID